MKAILLTKKKHFINKKDYKLDYHKFTTKNPTCSAELQVLLFIAVNGRQWKLGIPLLGSA